MIKSEIEKRSSLIAAICYAIFAVYNVYIIINRIIWGSITALDIIYWIAVLGMAVTLFIKNKKAIVAAAGVNACYHAYWVISNAYYVIKYLEFGSNWNIYLLCNFCFFVAYAGVAALIILSLKGNAIVKKSWFIPAAAMLLGYVVDWIHYEYFRYWVQMVFIIMEIAALLFVGMWIKEDTTPAQATPVNEYATFDPQAMYSAPASTSAIGGADKLKTYKELLESGIITQEEFDAKKKQILGL